MATFIDNPQSITPTQNLYTPDFSFIDKMLKRKEAQYEEGFAQLNNQYNLINKDLTNPANVKYRDNFLQAAKNNLKDLSAMDLSDMQNVRSASSVFKPFYSNLQVIQDQVLTSHWNKEEQTAESYRLKDGGKEFSPDNLRYIQLQRAAFAADDPSTVGKYAAQRRYYTPYYDYNKEIKEAMKDFKPTHTTVQSINGMYKVTVEDQSWNKEEISQYLNSVLSDKAKQQMRIEAEVRLGQNQNFLLNQYMETEAPRVENLTKLIDKLDSQIKTEKDPSVLEQLNKNREYYDSQRASVSSNLRALRSGDLSFLKENSEQLSYDAYYGALTNKYAGGYSHKDISQKIDGDEVGMMYFKEQQANNRQQQSLAAEWERMLYKDKQDWNRTIYSQAREDERKKQEIIANYGGPGIPVKGLKAQPVDNSVEGLQANFNNALVAKQNAYMDLCDHIIEMGGGKFKSIDQLDTPEGKAYVNKWIRENYSTDETCKKFIQAGSAASNAQSAIVNHTTTFYNNLKQNIGIANYNILRTYEKALATNGGNTAAAIAATGQSAAVVNSILNSKNQAWQKYESDEKNKVGVSANGVMISKTSKVWGNAMGYFTQVIPDADVLGMAFYPETSGNTFDIGVTVSDKLAAELDKDKEGTALKTKYKAIFGKDVDWDAETKMLVFKGLGKDMVPQFDPLAGVPGYERSVLSSIINSRVAPGEQTAPGTFHIADGGGKQRTVQIYTKNNVTYTKIDNVIYQPSTGDWGNPGMARLGVERMLSTNPTSTIDQLLQEQLKKH